MNTCFVDLLKNTQSYRRVLQLCEAFRRCNLCKSCIHVIQQLENVKTPRKAGKMGD